MTDCNADKVVDNVYEAYEAYEVRSSLLEMSRQKSPTGSPLVVMWRPKSSAAKINPLPNAKNRGALITSAS